MGLLPIGSTKTKAAVEHPAHVLATQRLPPCSAYWTFQEVGWQWWDVANAPQGGGKSPLLLTEIAGTSVSVFGKQGRGINFPDPAGGDLLSMAAMTGLLAYGGGGISIVHWFSVNSLGYQNPLGYFEWIGAEAGGRIGNVTFKAMPVLAGGFVELRVASPSDELRTPVSGGPQPDFPWTDGEWHMLAVIYDDAAGVVKWSVDAGAWTSSETVTWAVPPCDSGSIQFLRPTLSDSLGVDECGIWLGHALSDANVAYLFNGGAGRTWPL